MQRNGNILATVFLFCFFIQTQHTSAQNHSNDFYTAAVVEYAPIHNETMSAIKIIELNLEKYLSFIKKAGAENADIIVFPEYGLTSLYFPNNTNDAMKYTSIIPDPQQKMVPCDEDNLRPWSTSLKQISCEARKNNIYVVVNLPERSPKPNDNETFLMYNTNIVFDRNGAIIARYRKYNLFGEFVFNRTETPELITFDTDFGVTFGTFICFDILFAEPAITLVKEKKVTDFVYPTAWMSELPFLTALQVQAGWARANKVNLLAAGYNDPKNYSGGSGIYSGEQGIRTYFIPVAESSQILISRVMKTKSNSYNNETKPDYNPAPRSGNYFHTMQENMTDYITEVLNSNVTEKEVCHNLLCCKFSASFKQQEKITYRMIVYSGERLFGVEKNSVEICGIVACANETVQSCGLRIDQSVGNSEFSKLEVTGGFNKEDTYMHFPSTVTYDLAPIRYSNYTYKTELQRCFKTIELKANQQLSNVLGFGIYGIKKSSASSNVPLLLLVSITTFVLLWNKNNV